MREKEKGPYKSIIKDALKRAKVNDRANKEPIQTSVSPHFTAKATAVPVSTAPDGHTYRVVVGDQSADLKAVQDLPAPRGERMVQKSYIPSFIHKPKPRSTDFPSSIDFHPELKGAQTDPLGKWPS